MNQDDRKTSTGERLSTRRRLLRKRVVAGTVALFIAVWTVIFVQLASGHDPALSRTSTNQTGTTGSSNSTSAATTTSSSSTSASGSTSTSPITTSQS